MDGWSGSWVDECSLRGKEGGDEVSPSPLLPTHTLEQWVGRGIVYSSDLIFSVRYGLFQLGPRKGGVGPEACEAIVSGSGYSTPAGRPLSCCRPGAQAWMKPCPQEKGSFNLQPCAANVNRFLSPAFPSEDKVWRKATNILGLTEAMTSGIMFY